MEEFQKILPQGSDTVYLSALLDIGAVVYVYDTGNDELITHNRSLRDGREIDRKTPNFLATLATRGLVHPDDVEKIAGLLTITEGTAKTCIRAKGPNTINAPYRWLEVHGTACPAPDGKSTQIVGYSRDVTISRYHQEGYKIINLFGQLGDFPAEINIVIQMLGDVFSLDCANIVLTDWQNGSYSLRHAWYAEHQQPPTGVHTLPLEDWRQFARLHNNNELVVLQSAAENHFSPAGREFLFPNDRRTVLSAQLFTDGNFSAWIMLGNCHRPREWRADEIHILNEIIACIRANMRRHYNERNLSERLRISSLVLDNIDYGVSLFATDKDGDHLHALFLNDGFYRMFGFTKQDYSARRDDPFSRVYPEDRDNLRRVIKLALKQETIMKTEFRWQAHSAAALKYIHVRGVRVPSALSDTPVVLAIFEDITEGHLAAEENRRLEEDNKRRMNFFDALYDSVPCGIFQASLQTDPENRGRILNYNNACAEILHCRSSADYEKMVQNIFSRVLDEDQQACQQIMENVTADTAIRHDLRLRCFDKEIIWVRGTAQKVTTIDGIPAIQVVFNDVTAAHHQEEALRISDERFRVAEKMSDIYTWEYNVAQKSCSVCTKLCEDFGVPPVIEDVLESTLSNGFIAPECEDTFRQIFHDIESGQKYFETEIRMRDPSGNFEWYLVKFTTIFGNDGKPQRAICIAHSLKTEKEIEKQYNDELMYRQSMLNDTLLSLCFNFNNGKVEYLNSLLPPGFSSINRTSYADFVKDYEKFIPYESDRRKLHELQEEVKNAAVTGVIEGRRTWNTEYRLQIAEHNIIWVSSTCNLMRRPGTNETVAFVYIKDINESKLTQTLINSVAVLDYDYIAYLDLVNDCCVTISITGDSAGRGMRRTETYAEDNRRYIYAHVTPEDVDTCLQQMSPEKIFQALEFSDRHIIYFNCREDDKIRRKRVQYSYLDKVNKLICMVRTDVTDLYEKENAKNRMLQTAMNNVYYADRYKADFIARMSHDIRPPMNAVVGMAALALRANDPERIFSFIGRINMSLNFLLLQINDILDVTKAENDKLTIVKQRFKLEDILSNIRQMLETTIEAEQLTYHCDLADNVAAEYYGDALRLKQVLVNLLTNAIKFNRPGGTIRLEIASSVLGSETVLEFKISDTGRGISPQAVAQIMEPLVNPSDIRLNGKPGDYSLGLGLRLVKHLVNLMNGALSVSSHEGRGTEFTITLPLYPAEKPEIAESATESVSLEGLRVMVVDDDQINRDIITEILKDEGLLVDVAADGQAALDLFSTSEPDTYAAILMDIRMPVLNGLDTTRRLRALDRRDAGVPVIALSANAFTEDIAAATDAGVDDYLTKPVDVNELFKILRKVVRH